MKILEYEFTKSVYELKLHEEMECKNTGAKASPLDILRVPGGWIYYMFTNRSGTREGVFVPYDNEFAKQ